MYIAICDVSQEVNAACFEELTDKEKMPPDEPGAASFAFSFSKLSRLLMAAVVLVLVDLARLAVLLAVDLLLFLRG
jgi:hypothetical protein